MNRKQPRQKVNVFLRWLSSHASRWGKITEVDRSYSWEISKLQLNNDAAKVIIWEIHNRKKACQSHIIIIIHNDPIVVITSFQLLLMCWKKFICITSTGNIKLIITIRWLNYFIALLWLTLPVLLYIHIGIIKKVPDLA